MPEQFTGLVEILNDEGQVVVTINPNEPAAAIAIATADGKTVIEGGGLITDGRVVTSRELVLGSPSADALPASFKVIQPRGGTILNFDGEFAVLDVGGDGNEGDVRVRDNANRVRLHIDAGRGSLFMTDASGNLVLRFDTELANLDIGNVLGGGGTEGDLRVRDGAGNVRIHLDGASGQVITSGADCAEDFSVDPSDQLEPGTVVVVDEDELLRASTRPYDRRVAGILSGGGGVGPGIILGRDEAGVPNRLPLALAGKAWCKVDASYGPIALGDLLTTSSTPGHAMNASDSSRAPGAIIGKALRPWSDGPGLLPVLVTFG
jgi:hypothetical protein